MSGKTYRSAFQLDGGGAFLIPGRGEAGWLLVLPLPFEAVAVDDEPPLWFGGIGGIGG